MDELTRMNARDAVAALADGQVTRDEMIEAALARHAAVDGALNALPTLCPERARAAPGGGVLHGLPVAIKDLSMVAGVRSTKGSPIFADHVPAGDDHVVQRIEARGGAILAKSNTPEFGAGANTYNAVFGATRNPWDTRLSAAGSSGGAAAALRTGMAWLAHGSDLGGSLRTPASFCGVVGLRPSPGLVPGGPAADPFSPLGVEGPMARDVDDLALFLDAMAGFDPREPLSFAVEGSFREAAASRALPRRVAFHPDLRIVRTDPEVAALCEAAARRFEAMGVTVEEAHPDLDEAPETFMTLRAQGYATAMGPLLASDRDLLKEEVVWNAELGLGLTPEAIGRAERDRGVLHARAAAFFETYDLLLCPTAIIPPYPVEQPWPRQANGRTFETYVDWLEIVSAITLLAVPALSLPCGFTEGGLPVGLQMAGRPRGEAALLAAAGALQDALGLDAAPIDPVVRHEG